MRKDCKQNLSKLVLAGSDNQPDQASIEDWIDDIDKWPDIHLIVKPSWYTKEHICTYKLLDAYKSVVSEHVYKDIWKGFFVPYFHKFLIHMSVTHVNTKSTNNFPYF